MKFILPVQFYCHLPVSQNPIPFLIGIFDKGTQFLVEFFVRADLSVKPFIISRAWNPRKFAEFGYRAFLFVMYFLYCQIGRFILYLAQNRLLSISSSFLRMQSPILLFAFLLEEACFPHAAFPIRTSHSLFFFFLFYQ